MATPQNGAVRVEKRGSRSSSCLGDSDHMICDSIVTCKSTENIEDRRGSRGSLINKPPPEANVEVKLKKEEVRLDFSNLNELPTPVKDSKSKVQYDPTNQSASIKKLEHPADKSLMLSFLVSIVFLLVALVLFGPAFAIFLTLVPLGALIKSTCSCCCVPQRQQGCCPTLLTHNETYWLHDSHFNKMVVQCLITLDYGLTPHRIQDMINARLVCAENRSGQRLYPRFSQKVVELNCRYAWLNDENFNIENHIVVMPKSINSQRALESYTAELANQTLPRDRPLWNIHILPRYLEDTCVVLFRVHPCLTDGISLVRTFFKSVVDNHTGCNLKPRFSQSAYVFNVIRAIVVGPLVFIQKWLLTRKDYNILHGPPLSGKKVVAWSEPYSLAKATRIKQVTRSTLNDVLMSVAAGNLRTYFQTVGVINPYDMLATFPIDIRSETIHIKMGSKYAMGDIAVPTNTEGAIPRLWELKHRMDEIKNSCDPIVMHGAMSVLMSLLPEWICQKIWRTILNKSTCLVTNLQGPDSILTFASREIKSIIYWMPPRDEVAVSISMFTYGDEVRMAVIADKAIMPDPEIITKDFNVELDKLAMLLANRRIPGEHMSRRIEMSNEDADNLNDPSMEEIQGKIAEVQCQLQDLKARLDQEVASKYSEEEELLVNKVESLKGEFRELISELRRKKSGDGPLMSDEDDECDGELRRTSFHVGKRAPYKSAESG
ncbi:unnamed protein product [Owenia fusiformis]|uniref:Diacylglycerol O-acyltransferase n=1 Tax=Owenia fusiformis TaxID=6347 RepID=A0A8S4Q5L1_OWEFU|nr:unnamed protein product [Owenia fusiformis]